MFTLTLVLVALFVIVAAIAKKQQTIDLLQAVRHGFHVDTFEEGPYPQLWWEDCHKLTALLHGERVTIKGYCWGTTSSGNLLFESDGVTYTLYGHHLLTESVWN